jgi:CDP-diacylglycerol--glycerol-3-phosphate 3-phosphatidyltransferase
MLAVGRRMAAPAEDGGAGELELSLRAMVSRAVPAPLTYVPNALTVVRLALIPLFVALALGSDSGHSWAAAIVFALAAITDQVDGWLARRWHVESEFGKIADPLADRLMIDAAVILLVIADRLPVVALVILARDLALLAGYKVFVPRGYDFSVSLLGKLATWILYAAIAFVLATPDGTEWPLWLFWIGLATAVAAGVMYLVTAVREARSA